MAAMMVVPAAVCWADPWVARWVEWWGNLMAGLMVCYWVVVMAAQKDWLKVGLWAYRMVVL